MGRTANPRLTLRESKEVRKIVDRVRQNTGITLAELDEAAGKPERWADNTVHQAERIPALRALQLLDTLAQLGDNAAWAYADHVRRKLSGLTDRLPMLLPAPTVRALANTFERVVVARDPQLASEAAHWKRRLVRFLNDVRQGSGWDLRQDLVQRVRARRYTLGQIEIDPEQFAASLLLASYLSGSIRRRRHAPARRT